MLNLINLVFYKTVYWLKLKKISISKSNILHIKITARFCQIGLLSIICNVMLIFSRSQDLSEIRIKYEKY